MKKLLLILVPILVVAGLSLGLFILNRSQLPDWQVHLNHYLTFLHTTGQASYQIQAFTSATQPQNFTPAMSAESYSDSTIFETTNKLNVEYTVELLPMPYPPKQVMCILLADGSRSQLVYVTLHNSLYNADWVVHISTDPWDSPMVQSSLSSLGCSLDF